ncbi:MAG: hypothetical protein AABW83_03040 [Nanoarchaeota archaeon]
MNKIRALFIFEILGKPPEHVKDSLEKIIDELAKQKGLEVVRREVHEPKIVNEENKNDKKETNENSLYSTFAEVEIITEDLKLIMAIVLNMLPSHVEILEPSDFNIKNFDLSSLMTELTIKMHKYDEIAKVLILERNDLLRRLNNNEKIIRESGNGE